MYKLIFIIIIIFCILMFLSCGSDDKEYLSSKTIKTNISNKEKSSEESALIVETESLDDYMKVIVSTYLQIDIIYSNNCKISINKDKDRKIITAEIMNASAENGNTSCLILHPKNWQYSLMFDGVNGFIHDYVNITKR